MVLTDANVKSDTMRDLLYRDRGKLAVYALATYGLALNKHARDRQAGDGHARTSASTWSRTTRTKPLT